MRRCSCAEKIGRVGSFLVGAGGHAAKTDHDESLSPPVRVEVHASRYTNGTKGYAPNPREASAMPNANLSTLGFGRSGIGFT